MPPRPTHLQRRDSGRYAFRKRVPKALQAIVGKSEIKVSLATCDPVEARRLIALEALKAQADIEAAWRTLRKDAPPVERAEPTRELDEAALWSLMTRWFQLGLKQDAALDASSVDVYGRLEDLPRLSDLDDTNVAASVYRATEKFVHDQNLKLDRQSASFRRLSGLIHEAIIEREKRLVARFISHVPITLNPRFSDLAASVSVQTSPTISALIRRFTGDPGFVHGGTKAQLKRKAHHALVEEFFGPDTPIHEVTRDEVGRFRDMLSTRQIVGTKAVAVAGYGGDKVVRTLSPTTANRYLEEGRRLMKFAVGHRLLDRNPFDDVRVQSDGVPDEDRRLPFSMGDLRKIFSAPLYVGCRDDGHGYAVPGPNRPRRARFWIPLICLLSGMRLNEACQLTEDDIQVVAGVDVFNVRRKVKTVNSRRFIPINPELKRLGFDTFVTDVRTNGPPGGLLFPELTVAKSSGYASDPFSKFFARFQAEVGVAGEKFGFHSFRHNFADELTRARVPADLADVLGGWKSAGMSVRRLYGGPERLIPLLEAEMEKLSYPDLDLSYLYPRETET